MCQVKVVVTRHKTSHPVLGIIRESPSSGFEIRSIKHQSIEFAQIRLAQPRKMTSSGPLVILLCICLNYTTQTPITLARGEKNLKCVKFGHVEPFY